MSEEWPYSQSGLEPPPPPPPPSGPTGPAPRPPRGAWVALVAVLAAIIGGVIALVLLPYVAPAYYGRGAPPVVPVAPTPALNDSPAIAVDRKVGPAVVAIVNQSVTHGFFGATQIQQGTGSGIIFDDRGYLVTNYHVVAGAQQLTVILADGTRLPGQLIGGDPPSDLAVVKVNAGRKLPTAVFADSGKVVAGQMAIAIGNPLGLDLARTVTMGVVSGLRTMLYGYGQEQRDTRLIQTDAAINPGNSGGPLCNSAGEVIGVNTWKIPTVSSEGIPAEGIGFAVPSDTVTRVIDDLVRYGQVRRAFLGVSLNVPSQAAQSCSPVPLQVYQVTPGGPADKAGIRAGDTLASFAGSELHSYCDLIIATDSHRPGDTVSVGLTRGSRALKVQLTLGQEPVQSQG